MRDLILYTTAGCHLCEQAEILLALLHQDTAFDCRAVDIADESELVERYGIRIPVVQRQDNHQELGWPFDLEELRRFVLA